MKHGSGSVRISLRLADGDHYPIFHYGDPDIRNILLIPATAGQSEAEIQFFHHSEDGSHQPIGLIRFSGLPESGKVELQLNAVVNPSGLFSATVQDSQSHRIEGLETILPVQKDGTGFKASQGWRTGKSAWILGAFFMVICLAVVFVLMFLVTEWGQEDPQEAPLSYVYTVRLERTT